MKRLLVSLVILGLLGISLASAQMRMPDVKKVTQPAKSANYGGGASSSSGGGMKVGGTSLASLGSAVRNIQSRVSSRAKAPLKGSGKQVVVNVIVAKSGKLNSAKVKKSSGNGALDAAALATVKSAAPFSPLPAGYTGASLSLDVVVP